MKHKVYKKVVLVIFDGFGVATYSRGNAVALAEPKTLDYLVSSFPATTLQASGPLVGLPWGEVGNSEVGHLNIGAGRIVGQDLPRITTSIQDGGFFSNPAFLAACRHVKEHNSKLHIMGMVSGGGVHSLDEHLYALLGLAVDQGIDAAYVHMFTDGRDTEPKVALEAIQKFNEKVKTIGIGRIATIGGRFYGMDRGGHWEQIELAYKAMVEGVGPQAKSPEEAVLNSYNQNILDEMILPTVITKTDPVSGQSTAVATISDNDAVIFFNFRQDRTIQLTEAFVVPEQLPLPATHKKLNNLFFVTMTEYKPGLPVQIAFPALELKNNVAAYISSKGLTQFHIAESEKYAHVTSFFNCGITDLLPGETREIVTSPSNTNNYVDHPAMSAEKLTNTLIDRITGTDINFFVANFANSDMVGHTGDLEASIAAVKFLDSCLERILEKTLLVDAALIITADHGNIEQMINPHTGGIDKDHTTNPVPFILVANEFRISPPLEKGYLSLATKTPEGVISDIAPTILSLFGIEKPPEMRAASLLDLMK